MFRRQSVLSGVCVLMCVINGKAQFWAGGGYDTLAKTYLLFQVKHKVCERVTRFDLLVVVASPS